MSDALARLLASPTTSRPERDVDICLAQGIPAQIGALGQKATELADELAELQAAAPGAPGADANAGQSPRKMAQGLDPRITEIEAERDQTKAEIRRLSDIMREHTGKLTVAKTISQGEWRRWADANPAREDGRDDHGRPVLNGYDLLVTRGYCNATALLERLGDFATEWDGEPLAKGQWDALVATAHPGDLKAAAGEVVKIYEGDGAKALPKSLTGSFETPSSETS